MNEINTDVEWQIYTYIHTYLSIRVEAQRQTTCAFGGVYGAENTSTWALYPGSVPLSLPLFLSAAVGHRGCAWPQRTGAEY